MSTTEIKIILGVSAGYFSIARHYGGCTFQGKEFIYIPTEDALIRKDCMKVFNKSQKEGKTFDDFLEQLKEKV